MGYEKQGFADGQKLFASNLIAIEEGIINAESTSLAHFVGEIFAYAGEDTPPGCLLCDGSAVSRTVYWELFAAIGTTYGAGDGSSTFNLPNLESRTIIGEGAGESGAEYALGAVGGEEKHAQTTEEMAPHSHWSNVAVYRQGTQYGWISNNTGSNITYAGFDTSMNGGGQPFNIMQPYIVMRYFITTGKGDPASGINPADYVVEWKDDDNGWFWRKWASGVAELWCYKDFTIDFGGADSAFAPIVQFPFGLQSIEFKDCSIVYVGGNEAMRIEAGGRTNVSLTDTGAYTIVTRNPTNEQSGTLFFQVKGTWKTPSTSGGTESIAPTIESRFQGIESDIDLLKTNKVLWSGGWYMQASQTATLSEAVSAQPHGIWLVFSWYDTSEWAPYDGGWNCHFVPKWLVQNYEGKNINASLVDTGSNHMAKTLYVHDTKIVGSDENIGTYDRSGITTDRSEWVLRAVIGV